MKPCRGLLISAIALVSFTACTDRGDGDSVTASKGDAAVEQDGVLHAATVNAGRYRLYVYHANGSAAARKFPVVVLNPGA